MAFLGQEEQLREFQDRFKYLHAALFIGLGLLVSRLVYLQILNGDILRRYAEENRIRQVVIPAPRGMIFDRNHTLLVDNRPAFDLEITPQYLRESGRRTEVLHQLASLVDMPEAEIKKTLDKESKGKPAFMPAEIKKNLTRDEVAKIESWRINMPGVAVRMKMQRTNLYGDVGTHLLGYMQKLNEEEFKELANSSIRYRKDDAIGKTGIEKVLEETLKGQDGTEIVEVDALGRRVRDSVHSKITSSITELPVSPGENLVLTIDQDIQLAAKQAFGDKAGGLVAIEPSTGRIIAMLSTPSFDPSGSSRGALSDIWSSLISNERKPLRDKTIQEHYAPGSTFKAVTAIAALEEGAINVNTSFNCPGKIRVGNRLYHCHKKSGHGTVTVVDALAQSCDIFFYRAAQKLKSVNQIAHWAMALGLGTRTGIELEREVSGLIPTEEWKMKKLKSEWNAGETLSVAIGQSFVLSTVLQLANVYATIANGGTLFKPSFLQAIETHTGEVTKTFNPQVISQTKISPETLKIVKRGLWKVVNDPHGTAYFRARVPGADFAGKTGTSQVVRFSAEKIYQKCENLKYRFRHHGFFAGFAPVEKPEIAIAIVAEHACSGSGGAGPIAQAVVKAYFKKYHPELLKDETTLSQSKQQQKPKTPPPEAQGDTSE